MRIEEICEGNFIKKVNITIAAAGTGGHINPGIAIADNLQKNGYNTSWLGTPKGMENKLINKKKFQFFALSISGIRNKGLLKLICLPFIVIISTIQAIKALKVTKTKLLIVMGGYVSLPAALAAKILNIKIIFVTIIILTTVVVVSILSFNNLDSSIDYILEWNYFALLLIFYLLSYLMWKKRDKKSIL